MNKFKALVLVSLAYATLLLLDGFLKYDTNAICVGMVQGLLLAMVYKELVGDK